MTVLHRACTKDALDVVEYLLSVRANPNALTNLGNTPLHIAAYNGQVGVARFIITATKGAHIETKNKDGMTPLFQAIRKKHQCCEATGKNRNWKKDDWKCRPPFSYACSQGNLDIVEYLLSKGAKVNDI